MFWNDEFYQKMFRNDIIVPLLGMKKINSVSDLSFRAAFVVLY